LFTAARIVGFEPDPETFQVLSENVIDNGLADVLLLNQAVYDGVESVVLYGDPATPACPQQSTRRSRLDGSEVRVPASRLSEHLAEPVDYLKLDVEGAEGVVLTELDESGKLALVRRMTVECHHHLDGVEGSLAGLLSTLERNGFGYRLEARLGPREDGVYQNVLVHAYSKNVDG
jgi:FkbM family methyltransferase